jgi:hypothetical protein
MSFELRLYKAEPIECNKLFEIDELLCIGLPVGLESCSAVKGYDAPAPTV